MIMISTWIIHIHLSIFQEICRVWTVYGIRSLAAWSPPSCHSIQCILSNIFIATFHSSAISCLVDHYSELHARIRDFVLWTGRIYGGLIGLRLGHREITFNFTAARIQCLMPVTYPRFVTYLFWTRARARFTCPDILLWKSILCYRWMAENTCTLVTATAMPHGGTNATRGQSVRKLTTIRL
jgi:hypothetical protein